jgi:hypothetical protein
MGLSAQIGEHFLVDKDKNSGLSTNHRGIFGLIGPAVIIGLNDKVASSIMFIDMMFGSSTQRSVDGMDMASARFGLKMDLTRKVKAGGHIGAIYFDASTKSRFVREIDKYSYLFGLNLDYRF